MTVSTSQAFIEYTGDGITVDFIFEFPSFEVSWMVGFVNRVLVSTTTVLNPDQSANPGGVMTFGTAPALDAVILVLRAADFLQLTDYAPFTKFPARDHEEALDKLTMITQQLGHAILVLEGDVTRFVLRSGDTMTGNLTLDPTVSLQGVDDFMPRKYIDSEIEFIRNTLLIAIVAVENIKADKSVEIITNDPQTLTINDPSLEGDVTITARVNSQEALVKTNQVGLIPPEHIPPLQGGILTIIGLLDASLGITPDDPEVNETGLAYIIIATGTITIRTFSDPTEQPVLVEITDNIVWVNGDNVPGLPEGWYFLPLSQVPTIATSVIVDDVLFPYVATNVQETFDRLFDTHLGTAATEDIQEALNDTTVGRIPLVGSFGWGTLDSAGTTQAANLDTHRITGQFNVEPTTPGSPNDIQGILLHMARTPALTGTQSITQLFFEHGGATYIRNRVSDVYDPWKQLIFNGDSPIFGTLNTTGNLSCGGTLSADGAVSAAGGQVLIVNTAEPGRAAQLIQTGVLDRSILTIRPTNGSSVTQIIMQGTNDLVPNRILFVVGSTTMIDITATQPQCIDKANTLRRMGWSPAKINISANTTFTTLHLGHTLSTNSSHSYTIPAGLGADGDLIQLVNRGTNTQTINGTGGVQLILKGEDGGGSGPFTLGAHSIATIYRNSDALWYIWGGGIS